MEYFLWGLGIGLVSLFPYLWRMFVVALLLYHMGVLGR